MTALAVATGGIAGRLLGEPPLHWHPVARYGSVMQHIEQRVYADRRVKGIAFTAIRTGVGIGTGLVLRRAIGPALATVAATCMSAAGKSAAGKTLDDEAVTMAGLLTAGDLPAARQRVRSLVGRNTHQRDEHEISRAVIDSVAENCVDAVTSSLFWAAIGGAPPCSPTGPSTPSTRWSATTTNATSTSAGRAPASTTS